MDRFELYLSRKLKFLTDMRDILKSNSENRDILKHEVDVLNAQIEIVDDIIHHFSLFVKEKQDV